MAALPAEIEAALARVELVVLDVDGVLTDGRVIYAEDGSETQAFDVQDGLGLAWLRRMEVHVAWISGRGCGATRRRAEELGVRELHLASGPKDAVLADVQKRLGVTAEGTLAMGDDLPDLLLARHAAVFCAPANARPEVRERADFVTRCAGGRGAVREVCEHVLRARGELERVLAGYAR